MKIGAHVKKAREAMGLSQEEYGRLVGITQQAVSKIESGASVSVSGETLMQLVRRGGLVLTERGPRAA